MQLNAEVDLIEQVNHLARKVEAYRVDIGGSFVEPEPEIPVSYNHVLAEVHIANGYNGLTNPYGGLYHPHNNKNHPNLRWGDNQHQFQ